MKFYRNPLFSAAVFLLLAVLSFWSVAPPYQWDLPIASSVTPDGSFHLWVFEWLRIWALGLAPSGCTLFNAPIFYPFPNALALSEHSLGLLPFILLLHIFISQPVIIFHLLMVFCHACNAWSIWLLFRQTTRKAEWAYVCGFLSLAWSFHLHDHPRFIYHVTWAVPLIWIGLASHTSRHHSRWISSGVLLASIAGAWQGLISWYSAQYVIFAVLLFCLVWLIWPQQALRRRILAGAAVVLIFCILIWSRVARPYFEMRNEQSMASLSQIAGMSLRMDAALIPRLSAFSYLGLMRLALASAGFLFVVRRWNSWHNSHKRMLWLVGAAGLCGLILACGPYLMWGNHRLTTMPYAWLAKVLPSLRGFRIVQRWILMANIAISWFGTWGVFALWHVIPVRRKIFRLLALAIVTALIIADSTSDSPPRSSRVWLNPALVNLLHAMPRNIVVCDLTPRFCEADAMLRQTQYWHPLFQGYSGYWPKQWAAIEGFICSWPSARAEAAMKALNVGVVIAPQQRIKENPLKKGQVIAEDEHYVLFRPKDAAPKLPMDAPDWAQIPLGKYAWLAGMETQANYWITSTTVEAQMCFVLPKPIPARWIQTVEFNAIIKGGMNEVAQLFWTTTAEPEFDEYRSLTQSFSPRSEPQVIRFDLAAIPGFAYENDLTSLRWDPVNSPGIEIHLQDARILSSKPSTRRLTLRPHP